MLHSFFRTISCSWLKILWLLTKATVSRFLWNNSYRRGRAVCAQSIVNKWKTLKFHPITLNNVYEGSSKVSWKICISKKKKTIHGVKKMPPNKHLLITFSMNFLKYPDSCCHVSHLSAKTHLHFSVLWLIQSQILWHLLLLPWKLSWRLLISSHHEMLGNTKLRAHT